MAAFLTNRRLFCLCRQVAAGVVALALVHAFLLTASGDEPSICVVADGGQASASFDIAIALSNDDDGDVQLAAYNQAPAAETSEDVAEDGAVEELNSTELPVADEQPSLPAEEVAPSEELEGPPTLRRILRPITEVTADASLPPGLLPDQVKREESRMAAELMPEVSDLRLVRGWGDNLFQWSSTGYWHFPLYFEEVNLERYGYQCRPCLQPFVSGAHFFLTVPTLPYQMTVHPPRECIYTLGHYRPGSCVPWQRHRLPWDARAAAVEAGVVVGLVFLIP